MIQHEQQFGPPGARFEITDMAAERGAVVVVSRAGGYPSRVEIEETRERMTRTIGAIEEALVRRRDRLHERLDVLAPVREHPWPGVATAFGVGLALALLTGGSRSRERAARASEQAWRERAERWEARARRVAAVSARREARLRYLEARFGVGEVDELPPEAYGEHDTLLAPYDRRPHRPARPAAAPRR